MRRVNINIFSLLWSLPLPELSCQLCIAMCFCSSGHHLVACEKLWPPCCSPSNMKKHASWLIIITTSVCCLVQLGRSSRETLAAFFSLPPHQTLGGCQTQWVISRSVIVSFRGPSCPGKWAPLGLQKHLHFEIICGFDIVQSNKVHSCFSNQLFITGCCAVRHDSLFMHWTGHPICWLWRDAMHSLLASKHLGCLFMSISSLSQCLCMFSQFTTDFSPLL